MSDLAAVVVAGPDVGVRAQLDDEIEIGRAADTGLWLTDPFASSHHARIFYDAGKLRVEDLGSDAGTELNGERLERARRLRAGDRLLIGGTLLEVLPLGEVGATPTANVRPLRTQATPADFVPHEFFGDGDGAGAGRYGALVGWTDSHVKLQSEVAALGLLATSALAVYLFVL